MNELKTLMSEIDASLLGCIVIRPRFTNLSGVIEDLLSMTIYGNIYITKF